MQKHKLTITHISVNAVIFIAAVLALLIWFMVGLQLKIRSIYASGIEFDISGENYQIQASDIGLTDNGILFIKNKFTGKAIYDGQKLKEQIAVMASKVNQPAQNFGVILNDGVATLNTSTNAGKVIDQDAVYNAVTARLANLNNNVTLSFTDEQPTVTLSGAQDALKEIDGILSGDIHLKYTDGSDIKIQPSQIADWITQTPDNSADTVGIDKNKIITTIDPLFAPLDKKSINLDFSIIDSKVNNFQAPQDGIVIDRNKAADDIITILQKREDSNEPKTTVDADIVTLVDAVAKAGVSDQAKTYGIIQLIGTATTPFTGSTKNRISNIKTGASKLNGVLITPGENFSTVGTLGEIDKSTGYVPELVILGDNTIPEFGGGLCQVSTTLFRAVLNVGLPVTERQSHSYRVSYYEKDGDGKSIGPGLDATIYDPSPDFRFLNDTGHDILMVNNIVGTKITFSFYGTSDGRTSEIIGPKILTQTPPPPTVTQANPGLQTGATKQTEFAIRGATTTATYNIHYADGTTKTQVFNSTYKPMPAIYEVGATNISTDTSVGSSTNPSAQ
jgi:vancomycin resistance protein YoaR